MSDIYFSSKTRQPLVHKGFESFLEKNNFCQYRDRRIIILEECGFMTTEEGKRIPKKLIDSREGLLGVYLQWVEEGFGKNNFLLVQEERKANANFKNL